MEKNNEKDIRTYERPEAEIMDFNVGKICQIEDTSTGTQDEPWED